VFGVQDVRKQKVRNGLVGAAALALVLGGFWHFKGGNAATPKEHKNSSAPVRVANVERRDMAVVEHTLGTVIANATVQVTARVEGTLDSADFKEGQFVRAGDLLFQIDPCPFRAALDQARAILQRDKALLNNAQRDKARYQSLYEQHTISAQLHDTATTNTDVLAATVEADKAALDLAQINLGYTQIRSPIDGKTGPLLVHAGNMVSSASSSPLVTIAQIEPVKLSFNLPQSDLARLQARLKSHRVVATIDARDLHGALLSAPVDFTSNQINSQSGTIELRADFPNTDLSLLPGQLVDVTVALDDIPNALVVPHDAVDDGPNGPYVYVVSNGRAVQHDVKILFDNSRSVAVQGDLRPGDSVIVEGQLRVVPDGDVEIFSAAGSASGSSRPKPAVPGEASKSASR
jgi:RND family efflux transporter, MFP subunit